MLLIIPMNRTPDQRCFLCYCALKNKGAFFMFRKSCFRKQVQPVSIFCVSRVFVFLVFVFKTSNQTPIYSAQTRFDVLKTENLFPKQVTKQALTLTYPQQRSHLAL